mgnify:CR=1 FL=1
MRAEARPHDVQDAQLIARCIVADDRRHGYFRLLFAKPVSVVVDNFNDDNFKDIGVANFDSQNISIFSGNGNGTFNVPVNFSAGGSPTHLVSSDVNHDTYVDLIAVNSTILAHGVAVLLGNDDGSFSLDYNIPLGNVPVSARGSTK